MGCGWRWLWAPVRRWLRRGRPREVASGGLWTGGEGPVAPAEGARCAPASRSRGGELWACCAARGVDPGGPRMCPEGRGCSGGGEAGRPGMLRRRAAKSPKGRGRSGCSGGTGGGVVVLRRQGDAERARRKVPEAAVRSGGGGFRRRCRSLRMCFGSLGAGARRAGDAEGARWGPSEVVARCLRVDEPQATAKGATRGGDGDLRRWR